MAVSFEFVRSDDALWCSRCPRWPLPSLRVVRSQIPKELYHTFDFIVIDPPFITAEVWAEYAKAAKLLLVEGVQVRGETSTHALAL